MVNRKVKGRLSKLEEVVELIDLLNAIISKYSRFLITLTDVGNSLLGPMVDK